MDGDRYHLSIPRRYQQLYKQVGQAHFSSQELAHNALRPLMKDIKGYGSEVIAFLGHTADEIEQRMSLPVLRQLVDTDQLKQEIEEQSQRIHADPRAKDLALNTCDRYLDDLDLTTPVTSVRQALISSYLMDVYAANFESPAMSKPGAAKYGFSHTTVVTQLSVIRADVKEYVTQIAGSLAKKLSLDRVRIPNAPRVDEIVGLDEVLSL